MDRTETDVDNPGVSDTRGRDYAFEAHLKEAEFLRDEILQCIDVVRRLTIYATSIAGAALPIIAGLISPKDGPLTITSLGGFLDAIENNHVLVQFVCLGVSLTSFAFLRIYLGTFLQIFNFARYFREYLVPSINEHIGKGTKVEVMHWENWLKKRRKRSTFHAGDADLSVEPILMSAYCLLFGAAFTLIGVTLKTFPISSALIGALLLILVARTIQQFYAILRDAAEG